MKSSSLLKLRNRHIQRYYLQLKNHRVLILHGFYGEQKQSIYLTPFEESVISKSHLKDLLLENLNNGNKFREINIIYQESKNTKTTFYITFYEIIDDEI